MTLDESTAAAHGLRRTTLPNGLTVLSEFMPGVRSVAFGAWVRAASVHEARDRMGVSHLLEHMVFKGAGNRSAREIAFALEVLGGSLDAWTSREHTSFQARVLDEDLAEAAGVIGDLVFRPTLRDEDLQLERRVVLEEISMVEDTPDDLVFELHNALVWGTHVRARRRQGWWVCAFGVAATVPIASGLVALDSSYLEAVLRAAYSLVLGLLLGYLVIRADLALTGPKGRRGRRAEEAGPHRPEPRRFSEL